MNNQDKYNVFNTFPNGGNSFNQYSSYTPHMMNTMRNGIAPFDVMQPAPSTILEKVNFTNPNTTLHNNLENNLLAENIIEYHINIDSDDRNIETYPNPFNYTVSFTALGRSIERD